MSVELKKFHLISDNKEVYVNPSKVVFVTPTDYDETTITLDFGTLVVNEKCDGVVKELTKTDCNAYGYCTSGTNIDGAVLYEKKGKQ